MYARRVHLVNIYRVHTSNILGSNTPGHSNTRGNLHRVKIHRVPDPYTPVSHTHIAAPLHTISKVIAGGFPVHLNVSKW